MADGGSNQQDRTSARRLSQATLLYLALTLLLAYPLSVAPHRTLLDDSPDIQLFMWTLGWDTHAFVRQPLSVFDANIFHPLGRTLAYSENLIGSAFVAAPVLWATGNPVLALNVVSLLSCVLCGVGAWLLARRLGLGAAAAVVCGLVFAFSPARFFRISQAHLTAVQWIPFTLAYLHAYMDGGRRRDLRLAVGFFTLQALTSGHGAVFLAVAVLTVLAYRLVMGEPLALATRVRDLGLAGAALLVPARLLFLPYRAVQIEMGLRRTLEGSAPVPESFIASPAHVHAWLLSFLPPPHVNETASAFLFPGFVPLALAAAALLRVPGQVGSRAVKRDAWTWAAVRARQRLNVVPLYALLVLLSVLLAMGSPNGLWGLVYWLPGMNFVRAPSRFVILAVLGLAVLAAKGFERLTAGATPRGRQLAALAFGALFLVESAAIPLRVVPFRVAPPEVDRWLARQPAPVAVAEVPVDRSERFQTMYMLHSTAHWQKTVHGYSGFRPALHEEIYAHLRRFPDEAGLRKLAEVGVTHVVVHTDFYHPADRWPEVERRLADFSDWLKLEYSAGAGRVYSLRPPGAAPLPGVGGR
jgi:hypothetical protein